MSWNLNVYFSVLLILKTNAYEFARLMIFWSVALLSFCSSAIALYHVIFIFLVDFQHLLLSLAGVGIKSGYLKFTLGLFSPHLTDSRENGEREQE